MQSRVRFRKIISEQKKESLPFCVCICLLAFMSLLSPSFTQIYYHLFLLYIIYKKKAPFPNIVILSLSEKKLMKDPIIRRHVTAENVLAELEWNLIFCRRRAYDCHVDTAKLRGSIIFLFNFKYIDDLTI